MKRLLTVVLLLLVVGACRFQPIESKLHYEHSFNATRQDPELCDRLEANIERDGATSAHYDLIVDWIDLYFEENPDGRIPPPSDAVEWANGWFDGCRIPIPARVSD